MRRFNGRRLCSTSQDLCADNFTLKLSFHTWTIVYPAGCVWNKELGAAETMKGMSMEIWAEPMEPGCSWVEFTCFCFALLGFFQVSSCSQKLVSGIGTCSTFLVTPSVLFTSFLFCFLIFFLVSFPSLPSWILPCLPRLSCVLLSVLFLSFLSLLPCLHPCSALFLPSISHILPLCLIFPSNSS